MHKRILLLVRDLVFRSKLDAVVRATGREGGGDAEVTSDQTACDLAVIELGAAGIQDRVRALVDRGIPVLAFGAHVRPDELRAAREAGAVAVPNSQVEARLRELLALPT